MSGIALIAGLLLPAVAVAGGEPPLPRPALAGGEPDLAAVSGEVVSMITDGAFDEARARAEGALADLAYLQTPPDTQDLVTLWQALGVIGRITKNADLARTGFEQACAVDPASFNRRLGADNEVLYRSTCDNLALDARIQVFHVSAGLSLYVDGRLQGTDHVTTVRGRHLVQVMEGDQLRFGAVIHTASGQDALVETGLSREIEDRVPVGVIVGTGASAVATGVLAWLTIDRYLEFDEDRDGCAARPDGCTDTQVASVWAERRQAIGLGAAGGVALATSVGLGVTWAVRW